MTAAPKSTGGSNTTIAGTASSNTETNAKGETNPTDTSVRIDAATKMRVADFADGAPGELSFGDDAPGSVMVGVKDLSRFDEGHQRMLNVVDA